MSCELKLRLNECVPVTPVRLDCPENGATPLFRGRAVSLWLALLTLCPALRRRGRRSRVPCGTGRFRTRVAQPLLAGTGTDTWDRRIRERGWILREAIVAPVVLRLQRGPLECEVSGLRHILRRTALDAIAVVITRQRKLGRGYVRRAARRRLLHVRRGGDDIAYLLTSSIACTGRNKAFWIFGKATVSRSPLDREARPSPGWSTRNGTCCMSATTQQSGWRRPRICTPGRMSRTLP